MANRKTTNPKRPIKSVRIPKAAQKAMDESIDRYIKRWARRLILVDQHGNARKLTEDEVLAATKPPRRRSVRKRKKSK